MIAEQSLEHPINGSPYNKFVGSDYVYIYIVLGFLGFFFLILYFCLFRPENYPSLMTHGNSFPIRVYIYFFKLPTDFFHPPIPPRNKKK